MMARSLGVTVHPHSELRSSFVWRVLAAGGGLVSTFALTIVAYRSLEPRDAAVFFAILAALSIGPLLGRLGLGPNAIRLIAAERGEAQRRAIATSHLVATGLLSLASAPLVAIVATFSLRGAPHYLPTVALTALIIIAESMRLTLSDIFAARGRVRASVAATHHVRSLLVLPVVVITAASVSSPTVLQLLVAYACVACLQLAVLTVLVRSVLSLRTGGEIGVIRSVLGDGARLFTLDLAAFVCLPATIWLANVAFDAADAAKYAAAATLAAQVTVLESLAALAVTPPAARLWVAGKRDEVVRILSAVATLTTAVTVSIVVAFAAFGSAFLGLAYGDSMRDAWAVLVILAAGGIAKTAFGVNATVLIISGRIRQASRTALLVLAVAIPAGVAASMAAGPLGLAAVSALSATAAGAAQCQCAKAVVGAAPHAGLQFRRSWHAVSASSPEDICT